MRIALVVPYIARIHGNRFAFALARSLSASHEVTVYVHTLQTSIEPAVQRAIHPARLRVLRPTPSARFSMPHLFALQLRRGLDRELSREMERDHLAEALDAVLVVSDEGQWLGEYIRHWKGAQRPLTCLTVLDLIDQVFLLAHARPHTWARHLLMPAYPILHFIQDGRIRGFDRVLAISVWSEELITFLYGRRPDGVITLADTELFRPRPSPPEAPQYIAVPTVSLDTRTRPIVAELARRGLPLVTYGPSGVEGVPHRGFLPEEEMVSLVSGAAATLFLFDYEALGMVPLESLAAGTPVVTEPKEGPYAELRNHPYVRFGAGPEELEAGLREWLSRPKAANDIQSCRASMAAYAPQAASRLLSERLARWCQQTRADRSHGKADPESPGHRNRSSTSGPSP